MAETIFGMFTRKGLATSAAAAVRLEEWDERNGMSAASGFSSARQWPAVTVQQQQRRTGPTRAYEHLSTLDGNAALGKAGEEVGNDVHDPFLSLATARQPMSLR
jgi:hypothetical protein